MRENSKDLAYGLIGTLKYEGILHLIKEGFRDRGSKQWKSKGTRRPEGYGSETNREYVKDPLTHEGGSKVCIT